jgi:methylthioribose-1-phosphate isomerase
MLPTIAWTDGAVVMIDQRKLPAEEVYVTCRTPQEVARAIKTMVIRGAPAIGVAAAMGLALALKGSRRRAPRKRPSSSRRRATSWRRRAPRP